MGMRYQKINAKNGLCIEIGYSLGGWGYRQNHLIFSDEVCLTCYDRVMPAIRALQQAVEACRDAPMMGELPHG